MFTFLRLKSTQTYLGLLLIIVAGISFFGLPKAQAAAGDFEIVVNTANPGLSGNDQFRINTVLGETYDYNVDWGDASNSNNVTGDITHTYAVPGTYTIAISGDFPAIELVDDPEKLLEIQQWGNIAWTTMQNAFQGCINMELTATDVPDLSLVASMANMFQDATSMTAVGSSISSWDVSSVTNMFGIFSNTLFNQPLNSWDVSNVTDMNNMFANSPFNQPLNSWDVSSVTNMSGMFAYAPFNQDISSWNVVSVLNMHFMFAYTTAFNQDISSWNVSNTTDIGSMFEGAEVFNQPLNSWDTGNVTDIALMFSGATAFNQPLNSWDVSDVTTMISVFDSASSFNQPLNSWDVSSVTNMNAMFYNATLFDQDLGSWDVSNVTDMDQMFFGDTLSIANYDSILDNWSVLTVQPNVPFGAGDSTYCSQSTRDVLTGAPNNWVITDAGLDGSCAATVIEFSSASSGSLNESLAINFPVLLVNGTLVAPVTIDVDITGGTAQNGGIDYNSADPITVSIPAGIYDGTLATAISIVAPTLVNNSIVESDKTIIFLLTNPSVSLSVGDASGDATTQSTHTYSIANDDTHNGVVLIPTPDVFLAGCKDTTAINYNISAAIHVQSMCMYSSDTPTTTPPTQPKDTGLCSQYIVLKESIALGKKNDVELVKKIQSYLNTHEQETLIVDGIYNEDDVAAVKRFQEKYKDQILAPWGFESATGIVLNTTAAKINAITCAEAVPCPYFTKLTKRGESNTDVPRIKSFLNTVMGTQLDINSQLFDESTESVVESFQIKYKTFVLKPWNFARPTGWWYQTTSRQANKFMGCTSPAITLPNGVLVN